MSLKFFAITLFVADLERASVFYREVFDGRELNRDEASVALEVGGTIVNLLRVEDAAEVVAPADYTADAIPAKSVLTLKVDELDPWLARLDQAGVPIILGPVDQPWGIRAVVVADPDGNLWEIALPLKH